MNITGRVHFLSRHDCLLGVHIDTGEAVNLNDVNDKIDLIRFSVGIIFISLDVVFSVPQKRGS